jgi:hypothetical protein
MSRPEETSPPEGTWTERIHSKISSTSGAVRRAVSTVAGHTSEAGAEGANATSNTKDYSETTTSGSSTTGKPTTTASSHHTATGAAPTLSSSDTVTGSTSPPSHPSAPPAEQSSSPTLTETPSKTSTEEIDPSPSGQATDSLDSSQLKSKDPSSSLPSSQTSSQSSTTACGDAPDKTDATASENRQVNKGDSTGSTSDSILRLKSTQDSGPVSMSGKQTSHPATGTTRAAGAGAPVGDPSSGQAPKGDKQGGSNHLNEPSPKSKEDAEDSGTGQKYVKSSGVVAEGGDFNASKPGAGV